MEITGEPCYWCGRVATHEVTVRSAHTRRRNGRVDTVSLAKVVLCCDVCKPNDGSRSPGMEKAVREARARMWSNRQQGLF